MANKPPAQKSFSVDPGRYKAILAELAQSPDVKFLKIADDQHSGSMGYKGAVDLAWRYDGTGSLTVIVLKEYSAAKFFLPYSSIFHWISAHLITEKPGGPVKVVAEPWHEPGSDLSSAKPAAKPKPAAPKSAAPTEPVPA